MPYNEALVKRGWLFVIFKLKVDTFWGFFSLKVDTLGEAGRTCLLTSVHALRHL